jgi:Major Facilitator Superfamily
VTTALGPFIGGWLVDAASWRWVFYLNVPLAVVVAWIAARHLPESRDPTAPARPDILGTVAVTVGLAGVIYALIEAPSRGWTLATVTAAIIGATALVAFPLIEQRVRSPLLPLELFRSRQFTGVNLTTLAVYTAIGGALFLLVLQLQQSLHYSALAACLAMLPTTIIMLIGSPWAGSLAQRTGPRLPMTVGPLIAAVGVALMARIVPGATYLGAVLPPRGHVRRRAGDHRGAADRGRSFRRRRYPCRHRLRCQQRRFAHRGTARRRRAAGRGRHPRRPWATSRPRFLSRDGHHGSRMRDRGNHRFCDRPHRRRRRPPGAAGNQPRVPRPVHQTPQTGPGCGLAVHCASRLTTRVKTVGIATAAGTMPERSGACELA